MTTETQTISRLTIAGLALAMLPLMTMWHEIGGHAATCALLGGKVTSIGAFYVDCEGLDHARQIAVACAGVTVNALLCLVAFQLWRKARGDMPRLILWLLFICQAFVAAGYFAFSGLIGVGDLAPTSGGGLGPMDYAWAVRICEFVFGAAAYWLAIRIGIRTLGSMIGGSPATGASRKRICHVFYLTSGLAAVTVGLFNPLGLFILLASAAASSFGGLAGLITIGFDGPRGEDVRPFVIEHSPVIAALGLAILVAFAAVLGPTLRF